MSNWPHLPNRAQNHLGQQGESVGQWDGLCAELASEVAGPDGGILHVEGEIGHGWRYHQVPVLDGLVHDAWCPGPARPIADWLRHMFGAGWVTVAIDAVDCYEGPADRFTLMALPERAVRRRPAWMTGTADCDWHEDESLENGNYFRVCIACRCDFLGHKRRHTCRSCHESARKAFTALTPEQVASRMAEISETVDRFLKGRAAEGNFFQTRPAMSQPVTQFVEKYVDTMPGGIDPGATIEDSRRAFRKHKGLSDARLDDARSENFPQETPPRRACDEHSNDRNP